MSLRARAQSHPVERRFDLDGAGQCAAERHTFDGTCIGCAGVANVEILVFTSSSYRQSFCFLVRKQDLTARWRFWSELGAGTCAWLPEAD